MLEFSPTDTLKRTTSAHPLCAFRCHLTFAVSILWRGCPPRFGGALISQVASNLKPGVTCTGTGVGKEGSQSKAQLLTLSRPHPHMFDTFATKLKLKPLPQW
eukprot:7062347-Pyramimonas_sp.AAC.1